MLLCRQFLLDAGFDPTTYIINANDDYYPPGSDFELILNDCVPVSHVIRLVSDMKRWVTMTGCIGVRVDWAFKGLYELLPLPDM